MTLDGLTYSREDILQLKNKETFQYEVVNRAELDELCYYDSYKASTHGLLHKTKTRRGTRAGRRYKKRFSEVKRVQNVGQSTQ